MVEQKAAVERCLSLIQARHERAPSKPDLHLAQGDGPLPGFLLQYPCLAFIDTLYPRTPRSSHNLSRADMEEKSICVGVCYKYQTQSTENTDTVQQFLESGLQTLNKIYKQQLPQLTL